VLIRGTGDQSLGGKHHSKEDQVGPRTLSYTHRHKKRAVVKSSIAWQTKRGEWTRGGKKPKKNRYCFATKANRRNDPIVRSNGPPRQKRWGILGLGKEKDDRLGDPRKPPQVGKLQSGAPVGGFALKVRGNTKKNKVTKQSQYFRTN